jgi:hypothetical protein
MHYLIRVRGLDQEHAERIVTRELGHNRREVLRWYLEDLDFIQAEFQPSAPGAPGPSATTDSVSPVGGNV